MSPRKLRVFIDTLPRWSGGTLTHLKEILTSGFVPDDMHILVYGTQRLFDTIGKMDKNVEAIFDNSLPMNPFKMHIWRLRDFPRLLDVYKIDVHFSVLGYLSKIPNKRVRKVVMCRNLQPHLKAERKRLPIYSLERFRLEVLHWLWYSSFRRADGVIFLTEYVKEVIQNDGINLKQSAVIPHGVSDLFRHQPVKRTLPSNPVILYISDIMEYKFQWNVALGVDKLRKKTGINAQLHLVGRKLKYGWKLFEKVYLELNHPNWIKFTEYIPYSEIHKVYKTADIFVFASTVETIGNILLEAMAAGLPIAYSNRRPMTDILGSDGMTFEPEAPYTIAGAIEKLLVDDDFRYRCASNAYNRSLAYSWERTAKETFTFLKSIVD